jgi:hypothetical protein
VLGKGRGGARLTTVVEVGESYLGLLMDPVIAVVGICGPVYEEERDGERQCW